MSGRSIGLALLAALAAGALAPLAAQEGPAPARDWRAIQRDQEQARTALERLDAKMQKIAARLRERQPEEAAKLDTAWNELKKRLVQDDMNAVVDALRRSDALAALNKEDKVIEDLNSILKMLGSDRGRSIEQLKPILDRIREQRRQVEDMIKAERDAQKKSADRSAAQRDLGTLAEAKKALEALSAEQNALSENPEKAAGEDPGGERKAAEQAARDAAALLQRQTEARKALEELAAKDPKAAVEAAKKALEEAKEAKAAAGEPGSDEKAAEAKAAEAKAAAEKAAADIRKAGELMPEEYRPAAEGAAKEAEKGSEEGLSRAKQTLNELGAAAEKAGEADRQKLAEEERAIAEGAKALAEGLERMARDEKGAPEAEGAKAAEAKAASERAAGEAKGASQKAEQGDAKAAAERAAEAEKALEAAKKALEGKRDLLAKRKPEEKPAAAERALAGKTQEMSQALEDLARRMAERDAESGKKASEAGQKTSGAAGKMGQAAQAMQEGKADEAKKAQEEAKKALDEAQKALEEERQRTLDRLARAELEERARKEREQAEKAKKMSEDLRAQDRTPGEQRAGERMSGASKSMEQAAGALERGEENEAEEEQEKAVEELEKAEEELAKEERQYGDLEQEQELLSMRAELEKAIERQTDLTKRTVAIDDARKEKGELGRKDMFALQNVADEEEQLAGHVKTLVGKLGEEAQVWVFSSRLDNARIDLDEVVRNLRRDEPETGEYTQRLQRDVTKAFMDLKAAFEREMRVAKERKDGGKGEGGGGGRRRLVPPLAELKMLKQMQENVLKETGDLDEAIKLAGGAPNALQRELLKRLATRQGNLADLLEQMNRDLTQSEGEGGGQ